ncbi:MAG: tRNA (adenosine(37)-N6)-threonylcarbamoyltransferase complex transferase subunit TsaD [Aquificae bacterium]|nr:tRNA (adenosine(37)-N6)-threonylcarbamoyltransferase complex transferase subunit TsaD [Aquificota bacterium]
MIVLGIETSCDDTAIGIYHSEKGLLSNVVSSQINLHQEWGGIYPELAAREHTKNITTVLDLALKEANITLKEIDAISATITPGLIVSLVIGSSTAKTLSAVLNKPFVPVHHIEAHIFANFIHKKEEYPFIALVVSGGHTELYLIEEFGKYKLLGKTIDDAVGEAYDKVARILDLGFPGGPIIDKLSKQGKKLIHLPKPLSRKKQEHRFNFSFSGLKTAVLRQIEKNSNLKIEDVAHSFQETTVEILVEKTIDAVKEFKVKKVVVAGGVSANSRLREKLKEEAQKYNLQVEFPPMSLCTDNGAMVAFVGYKRLLRNPKGYSLLTQTKARVPLDRFEQYLQKY